MVAEYSPTRQYGTDEVRRDRDERAQTAARDRETQSHLESRTADETAESAS